MPTGKRLHYKRKPKGDLALQAQIIELLRSRQEISIPELSRELHRSSQTVKMSLVDLSYRFPEIAQDDGNKLIWIPRQSWTWIDQ